MARHRKTVKIQNAETSSSSGSEISSGHRKTFSFLSGWKTALGVICFSIAVYVSILGYLETRVNTPFDDEKIVNDKLSGPGVPERFWGSYRPGVYMGMKSREPKSPVFGLMWYEMSQSSHKGIRHWCKQEDNLPSYGWLRHDGETFGEQLIRDPPYAIHTSFVKHSALHWTVRVNVTAETENAPPLMLIWYGALDGGGRMWSEPGAIRGDSDMHPNYKVSVTTVHGTVLHTSQSEAHAAGLHALKDKIYSLLHAQNHPGLGQVAVLHPDPALNQGKEVNFVPIQQLVSAPFALDATYTCAGAGARAPDYRLALDQKRRAFDTEFRDRFNLTEKGYSPEDISIAAAAMSNMVGGIGYFYGAGRVTSQHTKEPVPYWRAPLYTAVPSRSFFPRGFLWDEGFHGQLLGRWRPEIFVEIAAHWLDLLNVEGWIPREQILGVEALARVPKEFVVQSNAAANPPMLLITLSRVVALHPALFQPHGAYRATLARMYPRLQAWYNWFQTTQKGEEPTSYRWRGRVDDGLQLNPKSLSSGLDDYPRASHPSDIERHLDLRCWMFAAADSLSHIANVLQLDASKYEFIRDQLSDERSLNELHWAPHSQTYADYGLHSDSVRLVRQHGAAGSGTQTRVVRAVAAPPHPRLVVSAQGYVSLFPMLLKVLHASSPKLGMIFETLDDPKLMWSPYGLRSLSKSSPFYMKRNTEHDPPYWRGQVWINMNYLALGALKHYSLSNSQYAARARDLHDALRENVVGNILKEYKRTGYLWEQYSDTTGHGSGCRPFTGWTGLVTLIMAEEY